MSPFLPQTYIRVHNIFQYLHSSFVYKYMIIQELNYAVKRFLKRLTSSFIFTDLKILPEKFGFLLDAPSQWLHQDELGPVFPSFCRHLGIPKACSFRGISGSFLTSFWEPGSVCSSTQTSGTVGHVQLSWRRKPFIQVICFSKHPALHKSYQIAY